MSGAIEMELDGVMVQLKAGDVLVQRGTIHNWVNRGIEPCMVAFVLVSAKPVTASGKKLDAVGASGVDLTFASHPRCQVFVHRK